MTRRLFAFALIAALPAHAAQFVTWGDVEVHYIVVNTMGMAPDIARHYGIVRGRDRAIVNVSIIGPDGLPRDADVSGTATNLLDQSTTLEFERIQDGGAIYFIAPVVYTDRDVLRFAIRIDDHRGARGTLEFQQEMWVD
jgi:hypothetical protein